MLCKISKLCLIVAGRFAYLMSCTFGSRRCLFPSHINLRLFQMKSADTRTRPYWYHTLRLRPSWVVRASAWESMGTIQRSCMGLISASSDTMEFEERQMKQCWIKYVKMIQKYLLYFWYLSLTASLFCWSRIFKRLWSPGIDSKEWIPRAYVAWRVGTRILFLVCSYPP
jgi:hypothetical protein